jgi:hypothetical protein
MPAGAMGKTDPAGNVGADVGSAGPMLKNPAGYVKGL